MPLILNQLCHCYVLLFRHESEDDTAITRGCFRSTVRIPKEWQGWRSVGNWRRPGSVRRARTKQQGLCDRHRNVPPLTCFKGLFDVQHHMLFLFCFVSFSPMTNTQEGLQGTCANTRMQCQIIFTFQNTDTPVGRSELKSKKGRLSFTPLSSCFSFLLSLSRLARLDFMTSNQTQAAGVVVTEVK